MAADRDLRETLRHLYGEPSDIRRVLHDAGIDSAKIELSGSADLIWFRVLDEAGKHGPDAIRRLKEVAHRDYPEAVPKPAPAPPPAEAAIAPYLELAWRKQRKLRLLGYHSRDKIQLTLDEVFIDLHARVGRLKPGAPRPLRSAAGIETEEMWESSSVVDLEGALRVAEERGKLGLVLLGDPGAGKTTLLRHLLCRVVAEGSAAIGLPAGLCPVLVRFSHIEAEDRAARGLGRVLRRELGAEGFPKVGELLAEGGRGLLVLIDGLDEVRDETTRVALCRWLDDEVDYWPGSRFVATCRFAAWQRDATLHDQFLTADIQWLDPPKVRRFVERWYLAVEVGQGGTPETAGAKAEDLLAILLDERRQATYHLREITENPLLLGTICLVHYSGDRLPEKRARLYDDCIGFLLETWAERRHGKASLPNAAARQVLQPLAWRMHERQERTLSGEEVRRAIEPIYGQIQGLDVSLDEFLRRARDDCGLLTGSDIDRYEFLHLSFQEYLAAAHARADGRVGELANRLGQPYWRETILLAMSMDGVFAPFMRRVVESGAVAANVDFLRECFDESERLDPTPFLGLLAQAPATGRGWLAAFRRWFGPAPVDAREVVAVLELFRGRGIGAVAERARAWVDHAEPGLGRLARELGGLAAADAGSESLPPVVAGIEWVLVPAATFVMGSSKTPGERNYDLEAHKQELPAHEVRITRTFALSRYPVTNESYGRFLAEGGHAAPPYWSDPRFNAPRQPVVGVNWSEATEFCSWLTTELGSAWRVDLPSEAEWELAARGTDGRRYPWGNAPPTPERAVFDLPWNSRQPAVVGGRPSGASPCGAEDMAGNVWEWCRDTWVDTYATLLTTVDDPCHQVDGGSPRVLRGGSWSSGPWSLRAAGRLRDVPRDRVGNVGFRVVCRPVPEPLAP